MVIIVRDHIPLEQGLRPRVVKSIELAMLRQRPYSIRTRIKTLLFRLSVQLALQSETIFH